MRKNKHNAQPPKGGLTETMQMLGELAVAVWRMIPLPGKILIIVIPTLAIASGWYVYQIYKERSPMYEDFAVDGYNMTNEMAGDFVGNNGQLVGGGGNVNGGGYSLTEGNRITSQKFWVKWSFSTKNHGNDLVKNDEDICYYAPVTLPVRKPEERYLHIGYYPSNTLRIRWSEKFGVGPRPFNSKIIKRYYLPITDNFDEPDSLSNWDETKQAPIVDQPGVPWITVKAVQSCPCNQSAKAFFDSEGQPYSQDLKFCKG